MNLRIPSIKALLNKKNSKKEKQFDIYSRSNGFSTYRATSINQQPLVDAMAMERMLAGYQNSNFLLLLELLKTYHTVALLACTIIVYLLRHNFIKVVLKFEDQGLHVVSSPQDGG